MLLRWMVRKDEIDLGVWQTDLIKPKKLYAVMDTHVAQQAQRMGIISYPKESWKVLWNSLMFIANGMQRIH